ncbi:MAG: hemerythrin family protein [Opitutaceae bacterium]|jgi:hemerythrin-like metal-binding protein
MSIATTPLDPDLCTGHLQIDADHVELLSQLAKLKEALDGGSGREKTVDMIVTLQKYTLGHFAREEEHMVRVNCPSLTRNIAAHREFSRRVENWLDLLTVSGAPVSILLDVHREATAWIRAHIIGIDCGLRGCVHR